MRTILLAAAALLASMPALAQDQTATAAPASLTAPAQAPKKLICRFMTHEGTLVGKPVCMTKEGWELAGYQARKEFSDFQMRHYSR